MNSDQYRYLFSNLPWSFSQNFVITVTWNRTRAAILVQKGATKNLVKSSYETITIWHLIDCKMPES